MAAGDRAGARFGQYELRRLLGVGGMGEVYEAYDTVRDRVVAIKLLDVELAKSATYVERFRRESRTAARLQEPHVIPVHDWGEVDGVLYIDMRLVRGRDLKAYLHEDGPMSPADAVTVVEQIGSALDAAHETGLVHRDIKPGNIILTGELFAYLVDFGIAHAESDAQLTGTGSAIGSFAYMSPERFEHHATVSPAADIYALACVLYECLTGSTPFRTENNLGTIRAHMLTPPPQPSLHPGVPPGLDAVVATGMAKHPAHRYASAGQLARAARAAVQRGAPTVSGEIGRPGTLPTIPYPPAAQPNPPGAAAGTGWPPNAPDAQHASGPTGYPPAQQHPSGPTGYPPGQQHPSGPVAHPPQVGLPSGPSRNAQVGSPSGPIGTPPQYGAASGPVYPPSQGGRTPGPTGYSFGRGGVSPNDDLSSGAVDFGPQGHPSGPVEYSPGAQQPEPGGRPPRGAGAMGFRGVPAADSGGAYSPLPEGYSATRAGEPAGYGGPREHPSAPLPLPDKERGSMPVLVGALVAVVVLLGGVLGWVLLSGGDDSKDKAASSAGSAGSASGGAQAGGGTTKGQTTTAVFTTTLAPLVGSVSGTDGQGFVGGPRCNADNPAVAYGRTASSRVLICRTGVGRYYYKGVRISDGAGIELDDPSSDGGGGWTVTNPKDGTQYRITADALVITKKNGKVDSNEAMIEYAHR